MRWSSIVKTNDEEIEQSDVTVMSYVPKQFDLQTPDSALQYLQEKARGSDFVMNDVLRVLTGVEDIERKTEEQTIELKVLEKVSVLQEEAYQKAYELGLEEGRKQAVGDTSAELQQKSQMLDQLLENMQQIKEEMVRQNEAHIMKMIYEVATRLAFDHVNENQDLVLKVIKKSIEDAQADENVNVLVAPEQLAFLEHVQQSAGRQNDFLKKIKFVASDSVSVGSCVVETNYGVIDSRIEERVSKLWAELKQAVPKVKSPIEPS
ncbi:FliH/SctL family protein [Pseudobdellovibrio exovorus]|uniref:Flagellar assembly protein FliH n=1 Tax=Pseudobdellovibrio exovorus JSS TaxID=1184267 RepID=M4VCZ6_9BACT|nr:FliH/SctL family protein [Pseudobdellovibrio exovorus]AGH96360.1 flagellar assembly protein [Pseudobdellovibrio exovorus JSS]